MYCSRLSCLPSIAKLELEDKAARNLREMLGRLRQEAAQLILDLRYDPHLPESAALSREYGDLRRIKLDGWRVLYRVYSLDRAVKIISIEKRGPETYQNIFS